MSGQTVFVCSQRIGLAYNVSVHASREGALDELRRVVSEDVAAREQARAVSSVTESERFLTWHPVKEDRFALYYEDASPQDIPVRAFMTMEVFPYVVLA